MTVPALATRLYWNAFTLWQARGERKLPYRPLAEILELQSRRVQAMVAHAYRHVPFYRDAMDQRGLKPGDFQTAADLAKLPLIDARIYFEEQPRFQADNFAQRAGLTIDSSGTSGRAKQLRYEARALFLAMAQAHRQRIVYSRFCGRPLGYREMRFERPGGMSSQIRRFYESYSWTPARLDLKRQAHSVGDLSIEKAVEDLYAFRPDIVTGYGSYIGVLFREAHRRNIEVYRPKLVAYGGDRMPDADRRLIEQELGIPVVSTYQCAEALRIGFFCEERRGFHLSLDAVAVRLVDDQGRDAEPGAPGQVVISNLTNRATVFLNYRLGDIATPGLGPCPCGRTLPVIEDLKGRSDDLLWLAGGRPMHSLGVMPYLQAVAGVVQVQIVQNAARRFTVRAVGESGVNRNEAAAGLVQALRSKVGEDAQVDVDWMETIPAGSNGKVKAVITEMQDSRA